MKYPRDRTIDQIVRPDEPVFIIRAQDAISIAAIVAYAAHARNVGARDVAMEAQDVALQFQAWQFDNPEKVKVPDL
jgi:hypothetical protein